MDQSSNAIVAEQKEVVTTAIKTSDIDDQISIPGLQVVGEEKPKDTPAKKKHSDVFTRLKNNLPSNPMALANELRFLSIEHLPNQYELEELATQVFNKQHSVCLVKSTLAIAIDDLKNDMGCMETRLVKPSAIKTMFLNITGRYKYETKSGEIRCKEVDLYDCWMKHYKRLTFSNGVTFLPNNMAPQGTKNTWCGFSYQTVYKPEYPLIQKFLEHLHDNICSGNTEYFDWLVDWMADIIQQPEKVKGTCVVLRSAGRGTGKSKVAETLQNLMGSHTVKLSNGKHLTSNFNSQFMSCLFCFIEESFWSGNHSEAGIIRDLITGESYMVEPKGIDKFMVKKYTRFMLITNNDWAVPASYDERRFFVLDVSEQRKQDREYFKALSDDLDNGGYQELLSFLASRQITNDIGCCPKTDAFRSQVAESFEPHEKWLLDCLYDGYIGGCQIGIDRVPKVIAYEKYIEYCQNFKVAGYSMLCARKLGHFIAKTIKSTVTNQKTPWAGKQANCYAFPGIEICQRQFAEKYDMKPESLFD